MSSDLNMHPLIPLLPAGGTGRRFRTAEWFALFRRESLLSRTTFCLLALPLLLPFSYAVGVAVWRLTSNPILYELFFPVFHKTLIFQMLVEIAGIAYVVLMVREKKYRPFLTVTHALLLGLGGVLILTSLISLDANASFFGSPRRGDGVFFLLHLGLYIFLVSWMVRDRRSLEALFAFAVATGLAAFFAIAVTIFISGPQDLLRREAWLPILEGSLGNLNFFGHYFLLLLILSAYFVLQRPGLRRMLVSAALCFGILLTNSNTAIVLAGMVFLILLATISRWMLYGALLAGSAFALYLALTGNTLMTRWQSFFDSMDVRFLLWRDALRTIMNGHPWLGYGWGNNELAWNFASSDSPAQFDKPSSHFLADRMHNILLESLSAAGVIGLLAVLTIVGFLLRRSLRIFRANREMSAIFFFGAFSLQFLYLLLNFDTLMSYILVGVLIAGFIVLRGGRAYVFNMHRALQYAAVLPVAVFGVALIFFANLVPFRASFLKMRTDVKIEQASLYVRPMANGMVDDLERALAIRQPYRALRRDIATSLYKLTDAVSLSREEHERVRRALTAIYEELLARSPMSANAHHNLALVALKFARDPNGAERHLEEAIRIAPANGLLRFQLGLLYFNGDDRVSAEKIFTQLLSEGIYVGPAHLYLGFLDFKAGRLKEGRKRIATALLSYHPSEAEWDYLSSSFLIHGSREDLLAWYPRLMGLLRSPSQYLQKKTVRLARELGRTDPVERYVNGIK